MAKLTAAPCFSWTSSARARQRTKCPSPISGDASQRNKIGNRVVTVSTLTPAASRRDRAVVHRPALAIRFFALMRCRADPHLGLHGLRPAPAGTAIPTGRNVSPARKDRNGSPRRAAIPRFLLIPFAFDRRLVQGCGAPLAATWLAP